MSAFRSKATRCRARHCRHRGLRADPARSKEGRDERGREQLSLLSTAGDSYDADYFGDTSKFLRGCEHNIEFQMAKTGMKQSLTSSGRRTARSGISGAQNCFAPPDLNQHHRAGDLVDPLWGLLDMTPEGRGKFFPKVNYD
jgi:predicted dithiol-disulfide oxidoreductase (DUF899 family)